MRKLRIQIGNLIRSERTVGRVARNIRQSSGPYVKWIIVLPFLGVIKEKMIHKLVIISNVPINAVGRRVLNILFWSIGKNSTNTSRTVLNDAEEVDVMWASGSLSTDLELMTVPGGRPVLGIFVDLRQKEMMKKPDMSRNGWVEIAVGL